MKVSLPQITSPKRNGTTTSKSETAPLGSPKWNYQTKALKTLDHHIKNQDVLQFIGENKIFVGEDKKEEDVSVDEKKELIQNLLHIRKRLNEVKEQCEKTTTDTNKMKSDVDKLKIVEDSSLSGVNNCNYKLEQLKMALTYQKAKTEEVTYAQATYYNMLDRLKKDKIADQIKVHNLEEEYSAKYQELTQKLDDLKQETELHGRAKHFAQEVQKQVEYENQQRLDNLNLLEHTLTAREEYDYKKQERTEHIQNIADNAANEVDDDQKSWNELLQCHKFLKFFLKNKIDKQIKRYEDSEKAFQLIKAGTGLTDLNEIVQRFLKREKNYSELLVSIAEFERKVTIARKANDELRLRLQEAREKGAELEKQTEEKHGKKGLVSEAQRELNTKTHEQKTANLVLERVYRWSLRTLTRVDRAQNQVKNDYSEEYPQEKMPNAFIKLIDTIKANLEILKEKEGDPSLSKLENFSVDQAMMTREFALKNVRVRPNNPRTTAEGAPSGSYPDVSLKAILSKAQIDNEDAGRDEVKIDQENAF